MRAGAATSFAECPSQLAATEESFRIPGLPPSVPASRVDSTITTAVHSTTRHPIVILEQRLVESVLDVVEGWPVSIGIARYGTRAGIEFTYRCLFAR